MSLNSVDAYTDCPTREQRAWTGDSVVHQMVDLVTNPDWSMARWHPQLAAAARVDGMLAMAAVLVVIIAAGAGWWLTRPDFVPADPAKMAFALPEQKSIVVLPFRNQTGDEAQGYIPDALTESIIDALSGEPELALISRNTAMKLKGDNMGPAQAAEKQKWREIQREYRRFTKKRGR